MKEAAADAMWNTLWPHRTGAASWDHPDLLGYLSESGPLRLKPTFRE